MYQHVHDAGPVRAVLTDVDQWIMLECKFVGEPAEDSADRRTMDIEAEVTFSRVHNLVFERPKFAGRQLGVGNYSSVFAVVSWITQALVRGS